MPTRISEKFQLGTPSARRFAIASLFYTLNLGCGDDVIPAQSETDAQGLSSTTGIGHSSTSFQSTSDSDSDSSSTTDEVEVCDGEGLELEGDSQCIGEKSPEPWSDYGACDYPYLNLEDEQVCFPFLGPNDELQYSFLAPLCEKDSDCGCQFCGALPQCIGPYNLGEDEASSKLCVLSCNSLSPGYRCPGDMFCAQVNGLYDDAEDVVFPGVCTNPVEMEDGSQGYRLGNKVYRIGDSGFRLF